MSALPPDASTSSCEYPRPARDLRPLPAWAAQRQGAAMRTRGRPSPERCRGTKPALVDAAAGMVAR